MGAGRTENSVAPWRVDASRDFHFISSKRAAWGGGGCAVRLSLFVLFSSLFSRPRAELATV